MRKLCILFGVILFLSLNLLSAQQNDVILEGKDPELQNPIEFILDAFDHYSVIALGEGNHMNLQGADFRLQLIRDPRFPRKVKYILVEWGTGRYQAVMDRYIAGEQVPMDLVRLCWRETTQPVIWDAPIYEEFFKAVRQLNQSLPEEYRLRVILGDPPIDWSTIHTREELENWYNERMITRPWGKSNITDGHAYDVLLREVLSKGEKALAIFGDAHFAKPDIELAKGFFGDYLKGNLRIQLEHSHPGNVLSITTHTGLKKIERYYPDILSWTKPSMAVLKGTKIGSIPHGPLKLEDFFDAILWLGPISSISYSNISGKTVEDESYYKEALRRDKLWIGQFQETLTELRKKSLKETGKTNIRVPYLGQKPPGLTPELFAPEIITTEDGEGCSGWGNGMDFFLFQRWKNRKASLYIMNQTDGRWSDPELLPFSEKYQVGDFTLSPDGKTLVFASNIYLEEIGSEGEGSNIWIVEKKEDGWTEPTQIGMEINTKYHDSYPCFAANGNLYFFSRRPGGYGDSDLYVSEYIDGKYRTPVNLGPILNTEYHEWDTYIAPDESFMIYCSTKQGGLGEDDLYITYKTEDGSWSEPTHMGNEINTEKSENRPYVSPDGKFFFYTSTIRGNRDIYWVDAKIIKDMKRK
jgi:hypothetical protein